MTKKHNKIELEATAVNPAPDGHTRITEGQGFRVRGGDNESHEKLGESIAKIGEELARKGKSFASVEPERFAEVAQKHGLRPARHPQCDCPNCRGRN